MRLTTIGFGLFLLASAAAFAADDPRLVDAAKANDVAALPQLLDEFEEVSRAVVSSTLLAALVQAKDPRRTLSDPVCALALDAARIAAPKVPRPIPVCLRQ